jgi:Leucine-rich repeat (LRR) protein
MFIKKDHRKIDEILSDATDMRVELKLSKRVPEFQGSIQILSHENKIGAYENLRALNLYDNDLSSVSGIGVFARANAPLEEMNLGCNKLSSLPLEFGVLTTLQHLWLDDNDFETFPVAICPLVNLKSLRLSGNSIEFVPLSISSLEALETLVSRITSSVAHK